MKPNWRFQCWQPKLDKDSFMSNVHSLLQPRDASLLGVDPLDDSSLNDADPVLVYTDPEEVRVMRDVQAASNLNNGQKSNDDEDSVLLVDMMNGYNDDKNGMFKG